MKLTHDLKGLKKVQAAMAGQPSAMAKKLAIGLKRAGLFIQRESQIIVPVDLGILRNTAFTREVGTAEQPAVAVGYTAAYAIFVHENLDALHGSAFNAAYANDIALGRTHNRGANQQAKFLETPVRQKRKEILQMIGKGATIR